MKRENIKKLILAVLVVFLIQGSASADEGEGKGEKFEKIKVKCLSVSIKNAVS